MHSQSDAKVRIRFFRRQGFQSTSIVNPKILSRNKRHATCDPTVGWNDDPGTFDFPQPDHVCFHICLGICKTLKLISCTYSVDCQ